MVVCADTSFLFSLYGNDVNSQRAIAWVRQCGQPLVLSSLNEYELSNAFRFAEFRKAIPTGAAGTYLAYVAEAILHGRLLVQTCNLAQVIDEAKRLSASHTLSGGHRSFDVLHVAAALHLKATDFLTFDQNQKRLATAEGLSVPI